MFAGVMLLAACVTSSVAYSVPVVQKAVWGKVPKQTMQGECTFIIGEFQRQGDWHVNITLSKATQSITMYIMNVTSQHKKGKWYYGENRYEHGPQTLSMQFQIMFKSRRPPQGMCITNLPSPTTAPTSMETSTAHQPSTTTTMSTTQPSTMTETSTTLSSTTTVSSTTQQHSTASATSTTQQHSTTTDNTNGTTVQIKRLQENWVSNGKNFTKLSCRFLLSDSMRKFGIDINLNEPSSGLSIWVGAIDYIGANGRLYRISNYNEEHPPALSFDFIVEYSSLTFPSGTCSLDTAGQTMSTRPVTTASYPTSTQSISTSSSSTVSPSQSSTFITTEQSSTTEGGNGPTSTTPELNTKYDYGRVLEDSILFYEAQRSGFLPVDNRIHYRKDSATYDGSDVGLDLTGGWYDAGDHVKFNFPMAASTTILAWGLSEWRGAYMASGQLGSMLDSIKWPLDYFLKCWRASSQEYYAQVGNGGLDHSFWGRPEEMTMQRPSYKVTTSNPGSDVAAETAAALAIGAYVFKREGNTAYANELLSAAETLYTFANTYKGKYSDAIKDARNYYNSHSGYDDELCYSAAMLYKVTGKLEYLEQAETIFIQSQNKKPWSFSWDDKTVGCQVLLFEATGKAVYRNLVASFLQSYMAGGDVHHTPKGLAWRDQWGALRYSANSAFIALMAAKTGIADSPALVTSYRDYARGQLHYMLGENEINRSYVIGFGNNFPTQPHHRSSSCDDLPAPCNDSNQYRAGPSPQILYGALVGGPGRNGQFTDRRSDYIQNEVACDYNAGFQSVVAGILDLALP
ncbi:Endoglucanase E-4 [Mizuhopecten yessoensis]|uniref:Endoglucanase n=1 Tax=Mizuhopecten yessoensis TaxID=6573 RepID=A0A210R6D1_MIZYE|nr:Endoglucanase E-4 [Mizuhopecten yessoensis]